MDDSLTDLEPRRLAKYHYWSGLKISRIAEMLGLPASTISAWKTRDEWDKSTPLERMEGATEARYIQLVMMSKKGNGEFAEMDALLRGMERMSRIRKHEATGKEADLNPKVNNRNAGPKKQPVRNAITDEQKAKLIAAFETDLFEYQKKWYRAGEKERIRNILKSRQIGATFYFAREAFIDALKTGRNQIFLSASKNQANQFRSYICQFAMEHAEVELTGDKIILPNMAELIFLGTNSRTAQSYHGNLYMDEYFWIPKYQELKKVAAGMASQAQYRQTYFSTPSSLMHDAYPFWSGEAYNKGRKKADQIKLDVKHAALAAGRSCEDGHWRQIVTLIDAMEGGCDLFDIDALRRENNPEEFEQLFMCQFIDDGNSIFSLQMMQTCMVDSWEVWTDYKPFAARPLADRQVWIGYDPNNMGGDNAALVVLAPPVVPGGKFRVIERIQFKNKLDYEGQAAEIKKITERYWVTYIGIDVTGAGQGVYQIVKQFYPQVEGHSYSVEYKTQMVLKALNVIQNGRMEFDAGWSDLAASFMAIKKTVTSSGARVTYQAGRSAEVSHADLAWATMMALMHEPLAGSATGTSKPIMEMC